MQRKLTLLASVLIAGLILAACAPAATPAPSPTATPTAPAVTAAPTPTATALTIAIPQDASNVTPYTAGASQNDFIVGLVYDKLFSPSPYVTEPEPWLAESITKVDSATWIIELRSGIKWHDGTPFTTEDVKFTFEYFRDGSPNRWTHHMSEVPRVEEIIIEDSLTLRIICDGPCPTFDLVTAADLPIIPKHIWEGVTEPRKFTDDLPVGTGPYILVEHVPDQFYRFKANEEYFKGRPVVDELVMPIIKDPSNTFVALKTGEIDAAVRTLPPELLNEFRVLKGIKVVSTSPLSAVEARLNHDMFPFNVKEFRQALNLAIDRQPLVDTVVLGRGRPGSLGYPHPDSPWTKPGIEIPFDPAQSRVLLDDLDFTDRDGDGFRESPDGEQFEISLKVASNQPTHLRAAELVVPQLAEIGLRAIVETLDPGSHRGLFRSREFDIQVSSITPHGIADPDQFIMSHKSGYLWRAGTPYPEMDAFIERWLEAETVEARKQVAFQMQEFFNEFPTSIVLYYPEEDWAFRPEAYDGWAESPGYGIVHKWSFLPPEARGNTVTTQFGE